LVLISRNSPQSKHHYSGEIQVPNNNNIKLSEKRQLRQIPGSLPIGFGGLSQRPYGPNNRENNSATADNIHKQKHLVPSNPVFDKRPGFPNHNGSQVSQNLKRDHNHQDLLLPVLQKGFQKRPPCAYQNDDGEEQNDADKLKNVKQHVPAMREAGDFDVMLILGGAD